MRNPQLNRDGALTHFLTLDGLPPRILTQLLDTAETFLHLIAQADMSPLLRDRRVLMAFCANQQPLQACFTYAAKQLSAQCVEIDDAPAFSAPETCLRDRVRALKLAQGDLLVMSHPQSGAAQFIAQQVAPQVHVINAGEGMHAHPTQALADMLTLRQAKKEFANLTVTIIGDILHSGLARSHIHALTTLCVAQVRVVAPLTLIPVGLEQLGVQIFTDISEGVRDADVVLILAQHAERLPAALRLSTQDYFGNDGLTEEKMTLAKPDCLVLHTDIPVHPSAQRPNDIALRMAVMGLVAGVGL